MSSNKIICNADYAVKIGALLVDVSNYREDIKEIVSGGRVALCRASENGTVSHEEDSKLKTDFRLAPFFKKNEVLLGGHGYLKRGVDSMNICQGADGGYCDKNLTTHYVNGHYVRLCWHHDNQAQDDAAADAMALTEIAMLNTLSLGVNAIERSLGVENLSVPELCWWAVRYRVYELLPSFVIEGQFKRESAYRNAGVGKKDTNARYTNIESPLETLTKLASSVLAVTIDSDPPLAYMRKPKPLHPALPRYLEAVREMPSCQSGSRGTERDPIVAHHLIGHGEGVIGAKALDLFVIPLLASEHHEFHHNPKAWEERHGSQLLHVKNTIKQAISLGVFSFG